MSVPKRVLVTGGSGFLGSFIISNLQSKGIQVINGDINPPIDETQTQLYKKLDITNLQNVKEIITETRPDVILHLAGILYPRSEENPQLSQQVNVYGTKNIVSTVQECCPNCFVIFSSTIFVHKQSKYPLTSKTEFNPGNVIYAQTKIEAEKILVSSNLRWTIFRIAGALTTPGPVRDLFCMSLNEKIEYIHREDLSRAFSSALLNLSKIENKILMIGGGENCQTTYGMVLQKLFKNQGICFIPPSCLFPEIGQGGCLDTTESQELLQYQSNHTWETVIDGVMENPSFVQYMCTYVCSPCIFVFLTMVGVYEKNIWELQISEKEKQN